MADYFFGEDPGPEIRRKLNEMVAIWQAAIDEAVGPRGWSPIIGIASDGARRVHQIVDWTGGEGVKPTLTGYVGASGIVPNIAQAVDIRGPQGAQGAKGDKGDQGDQGIQGLKGDKGDKGDTGEQGIQGIQGVAGNDGWTAVLAVVADGERRVHQVADWTGGQGTKPTTGQYVGATGLVSNIAQAVDIRGPVGSGNGNVNPSGTVESGDLAVFADGTGNLIKSGGRLDPLSLPDIMPSLNLNLMQITHDPRIVVSRATERTYWDQSGVLRVAPPNTWPLEFDPATGECLGRSVWGSRTNFFNYSSDLSNSYWTYTGGSTPDPGPVDPVEGRICKVVSAPSSAGAVAHGAYAFYTPPSGDMVFWVVAKAAELHQVRLTSYQGAVPSNPAAAIFDLSTQNISPSGLTKASGMTPIGDGWFLCWVSGPVISSSVSWTFGLAQGGSSSFVGDGVSGAYFRQAQLEQGAFPSPYIPTEGSAVTRAADNISMPLGDWFNPQEWTIFSEFIVPETVPGVFPRLVSLGRAGSSSDNINIIKSGNTGRVYVAITTNGIVQPDLAVVPAQNVPPGSLCRFALAVSARTGKVSAACNGVVYANDAPVDVPSNLETMYIGNHRNQNNSHVNAHLLSNVLYPERLSNAQIQELSRL